jgi:uncharacterized protein (UPF0218 family)
VATLILTEAQRALLKKPLGELIKGTPAECSRKLKEVVAKEKPPRLVLIGDTVAGNAFLTGLKPDVIIIDHLEKRKKATEFDYTSKNVLGAKNAAGTITSEAWQAVERAVHQGDSIVNIEGEEDLLTLVAILSAPERSLVAYGQPDEGIVLVRVAADKKKEISKIIEQMDKRP